MWWSLVALAVASPPPALLDEAPARESDAAPLVEPAPIDDDTDAHDDDAIGARADAPRDDAPSVSPFVDDFIDDGDDDDEPIDDEARGAHDDDVGPSPLVAAGAASTSIAAGLALGALPTALAGAVVALNTALYFAFSTSSSYVSGIIFLPGLVVVPVVSVVAAALVGLSSFAVMASAAWLFELPLWRALLWQAVGSLGAAALVVGGGLAPILAFASILGVSFVIPLSGRPSDVAPLFVGLGVLQAAWWVVAVGAAAGTLGAGSVLAVGGPSAFASVE